MFLRAWIQIKWRCFPKEFHKRSQQHLEGLWSEWINDLSCCSPCLFYSSLPLQILIVLRNKCLGQSWSWQEEWRRFGSNRRSNNRQVQEHKTGHLRMKYVFIYLFMHACYVKVTLKLSYLFLHLFKFMLKDVYKEFWP